jgi:hypothetical protein
VSIKDRPVSITTTTWILASDPPTVEPGRRRSVIVARRGYLGRLYVLGAWYLEQYKPEIRNVVTEKCTGFYLGQKTRDHDDSYVPIVVELWAPMPEPPQIWPRSN